MTRHADHAAKIIAAARIRRESGRRGGKDDHLADCRDGQASRQRPRHTQPADTDRKPGTTADHSGDSAGPQAQRPTCRIGAHAVSQDREREALHAALLCTARPPDGRPIAARADGHWRTDAGRRVFDHASGGEAPTGGRSRSRGPPARRRSDEPRGGGGAQFAGTAAVGGAEKRGLQFPGMCRVCSRPGRPDYAVLVSGTEPADG